ncbi:MAG TPA: hypothetical protein VFM25_12445 [Verrucomicrobiae bacterium]|nr:hypothetical protein [Verrucomicrobiae bacterium]
MVQLLAKCGDTMKSKWLIWMVVVCGIAVTGVWWYVSRPLRTQPIENLTAEQAKLRKALDERHPRKEVLLRAMKTAASLPNSNEVSSGVRQILDAGTDMNKRADALNHLPDELDSHDATALEDFLLKPDVRDGTPFEQALKNSIMDRFCEMHKPRVRDLLTKIFADQNQNAVIRDYALQHLIEFYQRAAESHETEISQQDWRRFTDLLWRAVKDTTDSSIAGTALLGLSRLSDMQSRIDRERVSEIALKLVEDAGMDQFTRITALQVCARMSVTNALPAIWQVARYGETLPARISAIGALGVLGQSDAKPFLNELLNGEAESLKPAAEQALLRITKLEKQRAKELEEKLERKNAEEIEEQSGRKDSTRI